MAGGHEITVGADRVTEGNLQQHCWEPESDAAKELVRCVLGKNTKGKGHSVQKKHRLFELGATALARYLQSAMPARNAALWRSCDSEEKIVGPAAHKSKQPQAVGPGQGRTFWFNDLAHLDLLMFISRAVSLPMRYFSEKGGCERAAVEAKVDFRVFVTSSLR